MTFEARMTAAALEKMWRKARHLRDKSDVQLNDAWLRFQLGERISDKRLQELRDTIEPLLYVGAIGGSHELRLREMQFAIEHRLEAEAHAINERIADE